MQTKFAALIADLNTQLLERNTAVEAAMLALLTRQHLVQLGPPGVGKTMLTQQLSRRITGARYFEKLITKFSTDSEIFGPFSLKGLENDAYTRVKSGTMLEAEIVNLEEVFKGNSAILNSLLMAMNEREYQESGQVLKLPLLTLFGSSNELAEDSTLNAFYDRFMFRIVVGQLQDDENRCKLLRMRRNKTAEQTPQATISMNELRLAQSQVDRVTLPNNAEDALNTVYHALADEGIVISDRRFGDLGTVVCAKAWLEGETEVNTDHFEALVNCLWAEPKDIRVVERVVSKIANPLNLEAVELEDAAKDLYDARPTVDNPQLTQALEPLLRQLADIHTRLETRIGAAPEKKTVRAKAALQKVQTWHRALSQLALQSLSRLHMAPGAGA